MKILKGTLVYTLSNIAIKFGSVLLLPVVTRLLSPSEYGQVGLFVTISSFLTIIFGGGFYAPQMKIQSDYGSTSLQYKRYVFSCLAFILIVYLSVFFLVAIVLEFNSVNQFFNNYNIEISLIYISLFISMVSALNVLMSTSFKMDERYYLICFISLLSFLVFYGAMLYFIKEMDFGFMGYVYGNLVSALITLIVSFMFYFRRYFGIVDLKDIKYAIKNGFPMVFVELTDKTVEASDRFILGIYITMSSLGVFVLASTGGKVLNVFFNAYINSILPTLYNSMGCKGSANYVKDKLESFYFIVAIFVINVQLIAPELIGFLFPKSYENLSFLFSLILPSISLQYFFFLDYYFHNNEESRYILVFSILTAVINVAVNFALIPHIGVYSAILSTYGAYLVRYFLAVTLIKARYQIAFRKRRVMFLSLSMFSVPLSISYVGLGLPIRLCFFLIFVGVLFFSLLRLQVFSVSSVGK